MRNTFLFKRDLSKNIKVKEEIIFFFLLFALFLIFYTPLTIVDSRLDLNVDPINTFKTYFYTWNQKLAFGQDYTLMSPYIFPLGFFYFIFFLLSNNIYITQSLIYSLGLFIGFYSFVKFIEEEFNSKSIYNYVGGLLYIFNLYILTNLTSAYFNLTLPYLILPLQLLLLKRICLSQNYLKNIFYFSLATLFMGGINPPLVAINLIVMLVYFIHLFFKHHLTEKRKSLGRRLFLCFFITILINSYWIVGILFHWAGISTEEMNSVLSEPLSMHNEVSSYLNVFRTLGLWAFEGGQAGKPYFNYSSIYLKSPILIFSMYLLPLIALSTAIFIKNSKQILWVLFLIILSIPMVVATNQGIFANLFRWAYYNVPLFVMFRSNYKFIQVYIFALSVLSIKLLLAIKSTKTKKYMLIIFLFLIILNAFPFFTKAVFNENSKIKIPEYYYDAQNFFQKDQSEYRVLLLPEQYGAIYKWGATKGNPEILWNKGLVVRQPITETERSNKITLILYRNLLGGGYKRANNMLGKMNVQYIIQRNDFDWEYYKTISQPPEVIKKVISPYQGVKTFGQLDLYKLPDDFFLPHFYIPRNIIYSPNGIEVLSEILNFDDYGLRSVVFLDADELDEEKVDQVVVSGKLKNSVTDLIGIEEKEDSEIFYPYVKYKPGNWKWQLALLKEKYDKSKTIKQKDQEEILKKDLFYANKRISELLLFYPFSDNDTYDIWQENYKNNLTNIPKILEVLRGEDRVKFNTLLREVREIINDHQDKILEMNLNGNFGERLLEYLRKISYDIDNLESAFGLDDLVYQADIPLSGNYDIYIIGETEEMGSQEELVKITDNEFIKGQQQLLLPLKRIGKNLLDRDLRIMDYSPDDFFKISFDYQSRGETPRVKVIEEGEGEIFNRGLSMTNGEYRKAEIFFKSSPSGGKGRLIINADQFDNVEVRKIYQPKLLLRLDKNTEYSILNTEKSKNAETKKEVPRITFTKVNPTKYKVKIEGAKEPYTLVFSENFNKGWKVYPAKQDSFQFSLFNFQIQQFGDYIFGVLGKIGKQVTGLFLKDKGYGEEVASYFNGEIKEGTHRMTFLEPATFETWGLKPIADDRHYLVNGYANSWHITPEDAGGAEDYELVVEFWPQRLFYLGLFISGLTLFTCLGYLSYDYIKKRKVARN